MSDAFILSRKGLFGWLDRLGAQFDLCGPVLKKKGHVVFQKIERAEDIALDYSSTMIGPRSLIYPPRQTLLSINRKTGQYETLLPEHRKKRIIFGIHPCDMQAITVLDRTFLGDFKDFYYQKLRRETITIVLNCSRACEEGFCASMGTGPFLQIQEDFDLVLTANNQNFLVESGSRKGEALVLKAEGLRKADRKAFKEKRQIEERALATFTKSLDTDGLPELLMRNLDHPVYKRIAEARCLGCTNCTMVCPTCYCYNIEDNTAYDLKTTTRSRYWDSCQELNFARVHEGNFRSSREARLRQFVTHKLATWVEQYGCFGCIGCGRCMTWCPTKIDLTEIAKEIQQDAKVGSVK
jgi:sulfhydrogenase subunit beta (sulfur reductase)